MKWLLTGIVCMREQREPAPLVMKVEKAVKNGLPSSAQQQLSRLLFCKCYVFLTFLQMLLSCTCTVLSPVTSEHSFIAYFVVRRLVLRTTKSSPHKHLCFLLFEKYWFSSKWNYICLINNAVQKFLGDFPAHTTCMILFWTYEFNNQQELFCNTKPLLLATLSQQLG